MSFNITYENERRIQTLKGSTVWIGPGAVSGPLGVQSHWARNPGLGRPQRIETQFFFAASDRRRYGYYSVLGIEAFWPRSDVRRVSYRSGGIASALGVIKTAPLASLRLQGGEGISVDSEEVVLLKVDDLHGNLLTCRMTLGSHEPGSPKSPSRISFEYRLPADMLLWRRAPLVVDDDFVPEAAEGVQVKYLGPLDGHVVFDGLHPSAIDIDLGDKLPVEYEDV